MNAIIPFQFDTTAVRAIDRDGKPWFVAIDVCTAIGISNHRDALRRLDQDERGAVEVDTLGGRQTLSAVNESGLYALTFRSRGASTPGTPAHRFRKWVTGEVLPELRRTGRYGAGISSEVGIERPRQEPEILVAVAKRQVEKCQSAMTGYDRKVRLPLWQYFRLPRLANKPNADPLHAAIWDSEKPKIVCELARLGVFVGSAAKANN